ncbi:hypothetical protein PILCRDRAFT_95686 [Piloderma croceum F 1598]|uniref:Magnesium-dependent phosphatase-1 n=1 Tax=Piloderma croceum (strain F 1598) TaxID=765440 RepID=A0A0C3GBM0_PILCF|nr:hypothetical protein PILCRDRAFT_95686 [Piloderma croceum F 1598]
MTGRLPKLIAFDLDYTLWALWIDTHVSPPLNRDEDTINEVKDRYGQKITFYPDVAQILHRLRAADVTIAACSRTAAPELYVHPKALSLLLISPKPGENAARPTRAIEFFDQKEIYPGSKIAHFKKIHQKTGISYFEMLFFDDERRNKEVETLGVTFHHAPDGIENQVFEKGLTEWKKRHPALVVEDAEASV